MSLWHLLARTLRHNARLDRHWIRQDLRSGEFGLSLNLSLLKADSGLLPKISAVSGCSRPRALLGGRDSRSLLLLGDIVERELKLLQRRSGVGHHTAVHLVPQR